MNTTIKVLIGLILTTLSVSTLKSQNLKYSFIIDGNLTLSRTHQPDANSIFLDTYHLSRVFGITPSIGFFLNKKIVAGIGLSYQQEIKNGNSARYLPGQNSYILEESRCVIRAISPSLFLKHVNHISDKMLASLELRYSYGLEGEHITKLGQSTYSYTFAESVKGKTISQLSLSPELLCFLTKRIGIEANFLAFKVTTFHTVSSLKNDKRTDFNLELNPKGWHFGIFILLKNNNTE